MHSNEFGAIVNQRIEDIEAVILETREALKSAEKRATRLNERRVENDKAIRQLRWALRTAEAVRDEIERNEQQGVNDASSTPI